MTADASVEDLAALAGVRGVNMPIRALVITAGVLCADETPIRIGPDRSMETFDAFVFPDLSGAVLVPYRYQNYG